MMRKSVGFLGLAALAGLLVMRPAWAADEVIHASSDVCLKQAFELAQLAEEKKMSEAEQKKMDDLLTAMEGQCDAQQFKEAAASAKDIKAMLAAAL